MNISIEMIPPYKIAYIRRTGSYGSENVQIMEQLKSWAREKSLLNESSIILGIAKDNPQFTEPKDCRYDTCLVVLDEIKVDNNYINFRKTVGGKYCVFKISHTVDAMQKAWTYIFSEISKRNYEFDDRRPILERYAIMKKIKKRILRKMVGILICVFIGINVTGCTSTESDTSVEISFSEFDGIKEKEISLNSDGDKLNMSGAIKMKDGKVKLNIKEKDTNKNLYSEEFTSNSKKEVNINIDNLGKIKDLVLVLEGSDVKGFQLKLSSKQKLVRDKKSPLTPNKPTK